MSIEKDRTVNISMDEKDGKIYIRIDEQSANDAWSLVKDWYDIISNEENLKILADLNMTRPQRIVSLTEVVFPIIQAIVNYADDTYHDTVIRVIEKDS